MTPNGSTHHNSPQGASSHLVSGGEASPIRASWKGPEASWDILVCFGCLGVFLGHLEAICDGLGIIWGSLEVLWG